MPGAGKVRMRLPTKLRPIYPRASPAPGRLGKGGGGAAQGSTHTLLLVTRAPNQPFQ